MSDSTLIQQINTPVTGTLAASFTNLLPYFVADYGQFLGNIYTYQGAEIDGNYFTSLGYAGGGGGGATDDITNASFSASAASLVLGPAASGASGGSGQYGYFGNGLLYDPNLPAGSPIQGTDFGPGDGGVGGAATLDLASSTIGSAAAAYGGSVAITAAATGGAGGIGGDGDYASVYEFEGEGGVIFGPDNPPNGQGGATGGDGGASAASLDALASDSSDGTVLTVNAESGAGGQGGTGGGPSDYYFQGIYQSEGGGGAGGDGGSGGDANASAEDANVDDAYSVSLTVAAIAGAGGTGGTGGAPGFLPVGGGEGSVSSIADIDFTSPGNGGNGGNGGTAAATVSGNVVTAPRVTISVTAESGGAGEAGSTGLLPADATFPPYFNGDTYETEYIYLGLYPGLANAIGGSSGTVAASQIDFTNNTISVSSLLSLTLHAEEPAASGGPALLPLNGAAGGNLVFAGNSFIGDGSSQLDLQGTGSDATVDDMAETISIAGSPTNSMTGFDVFDLANGDTFHVGTQPSTVIYLAPDPDTIVLSPGHGAIVLEFATSANLMLDFQGYGSTFASIAQLEADTTTYAGGEAVIDVPGDGAITVMPEYYDGWAPSVANSNLADTSDIFSDQVSTAGAWLWSNAANWSAGIPGADANVIVNGNGTDDIAALAVPFITLNAAVTVDDANLTVQDLTVSAAAGLVVDSGSTVSVSGTIGGTGGTLGANGAGAVLDDLAASDNGETYQVANGGAVSLAASVSYLSKLDYDPVGTPGTFALSNPTNYFGSTLGNVAPGDVLEVAGSTIESLTLDINNGLLDVQTDIGAFYDFDNVTYNAAVAGIGTAIDPSTGLLAVTFTAGDTFNDNDAIDGAWLWSDAKNWSAGNTPAGGTVYVFASGTDDVAGLTLDSLGLTDNVTLDVTANLTIDSLSLGPGATIVVSNGASLSIQGPVIGADNGVLQADGAGSLLFDNAPSDPGETYAVSNGGTVILTAQPNLSNSELGYDYAGSSGSFVLPNPGTAGVTIADIQPGDVLELPGTTVSNVTIDPDYSRLSITTNAGTFGLTGYYLQPSTIAGYTASAVPASGLVAITFTSGYAFNDNDPALSGPDAGSYLWSDALNWAPGLPVAGAGIYIDASGVDDIAGLTPGSVGLTDNIALAIESNLATGIVLVGQGSTIAIDAGATLTLTGTLGGVPGAYLQANGTGAVLSNAAASDPGENYSVSAGGAMMLTAAPSAASSLSYDPAGTTGMFALFNPGLSIAAALNNVGVGDVLELPGTTITNISASISELIVTTDAGTFDFSDVSFQPTVTGYTQALDSNDGLVALTFAGASTGDATAFCFVAGTVITTQDGSARVECLRIGDLVQSEFGGMTPVKWIGHRRIDCRRHAKPQTVWPVRVRAGAFGNDLPRRDLWLSPDHAVFVDDVLIPIKHLINGTSIAQVPVDAVTYYHVELPNHDVLLAEGLPAESYLDTDDRSNFTNHDGPIRLHPNVSDRSPNLCALWEAYGCAPLIVTGPALDAVSERVKAQAATLVRHAAVGRYRSG